MDYRVIMPTKDRPEMLSRAMDHYRREGMDVLVANNGSGECGDYRTDERCWCCLLEGLVRRADAEYVIYAGDDDYVYANGVSSCVAFLDAHPEYAMARGVAQAFKTEGDAPQGRVWFEQDVDFPDYDLDDPIARLVAYARRPHALLNTVVRSDFLLRALELHGAVHAPLGAGLYWVGGEFLYNGAMALSGKCGVVEGLYWRQQQPTSPRAIPVWGGMKDDRWAAVLRATCDALCGLVPSRAHEVEVVVKTHISTVIRWEASIEMAA